MWCVMCRSRRAGCRLLGCPAGAGCGVRDDGQTGWPGRRRAPASLGVGGPGAGCMGPSRPAVQRSARAVAARRTPRWRTGSACRARWMQASPGGDVRQRRRQPWQSLCVLTPGRANRLSGMDVVSSPHRRRVISYLDRVLDGLVYELVPERLVGTRRSRRVDSGAQGSRGAGHKGHLTRRWPAGNDRCSGSISNDQVSSLIRRVGAAQL